MNGRDDLELELLLTAIFDRYHYDFRRYSRTSMKRRLAQALPRYGVASLSGLQDRVLRDESVFTSLLAHLTVQVTDMFRDPSYFAFLRRRIIPLLRTYPSRKLWVAGCSTGEEAYSLAIILREEGILDRTLIYATDINTRSLAIAEAGVYTLERIRAFTENHQRTGASCSLSEHYAAAYGSATFDRALKKAIVFADHSLSTDSIFAEMHLISCRNVLIYFAPDLQDRALELFRGSLVRRGFMGLGARESLRFSSVAPAFAALDEDEKWYQKGEDA